MTKTLVERLRMHAAFVGHPMPNQASMASEAADRIEKLEAALKWVGEVYPDTLPSRGARVEMTWEEFNAMREVMGLPLRKPKPRARAALKGE